MLLTVEHGLRLDEKTQTLITSATTVAIASPQVRFEHVLFSSVDKNKPDPQVMRELELEVGDIDEFREVMSDLADQPEKSRNTALYPNSPLHPSSPRMSAEVLGAFGRAAIFARREGVDVQPHHVIRGIMQGFPKSKNGIPNSKRIQ